MEPVQALEEVRGVQAPDAKGSPSEMGGAMSISEGARRDGDTTRVAEDVGGIPWSVSVAGMQPGERNPR
jgi:hypothetical protein